MQIAFYAPFKPLGHKHPSGDLTIAKGIVDFLAGRGHKVHIQSNLRARWVYLKPWMWIAFLWQFLSCLIDLKKNRPHLWLTYHTYYKAPDVLGPIICKILGIKYVIFQGIYSTKRKRRVKTVIGFYLNRFALLSSDHIITNKHIDLKNLKRIIPKNKLSYVRPGIKPGMFRRNSVISKQYIKKWNLPSDPIILSAAMFRDDVKTQGLAWLIECCTELIKTNVKFHLVIAGSGIMERHLKSLAQKQIPGHFTFVGKIPREDMYKFYSCGKLFAFPGIREALGMVYLEAQSCELPVIAFKNGGIPEVVVADETGFLIPMYDKRKFAVCLKQLLIDNELQIKMGTKAQRYINLHHDIDKNYILFEQILRRVNS